MIYKYMMIFIMSDPVHVIKFKLYSNYEKEECYCLFCSRIVLKCT